MLLQLKKGTHYTVLFLLKLHVGVPLNTLSVSITVSYCTSGHVNQKLGLVWPPLQLSIMPIGGNTVLLLILC